MASVGWVNNPLKTMMARLVGRPKPSQVSPELASGGDSVIPDEFRSGVVMATERTFQRDVLAVSQKRPVLVHFYNEGCLDCGALGLDLHMAADSMEPGGTVRFVRLEEEWNPQLADRYADDVPVQVYRTPWLDRSGEVSHPLVLFRLGEPVDGMQCTEPQAKLSRLLREAVLQEDMQTYRQRPVSTKLPEGWMQWLRAWLGAKAG